MVSRRRILIRRTIALGAAALAVGAVAGGAVALLAGGDDDAQTDQGAISQRGLTGDGWPWLSGNLQGAGAKGRAWQRCNPECGDVVSTAEFFQPGKTATGTRFRLSAPDGEVVWEDFTPVWNGQVRSTRPPTLTGEAIVGKIVTAQPGRWQGGWPDDGTELGVRACRTAEGDGCVAISPSLVLGAGRERSARIGAVYVGWYVGAIERRVGAVTAVPAVAQVPPRGDKISRYPAPTPSQTAAAGKLLGPVRAAG